MTRRFDADGKLVGSVTDASIRSSIREGVDRPPYSNIDAPALALYADYSNPVNQFPEFPLKDSAWQAQALANSETATTLGDEPSKAQFRDEMRRGEQRVVVGSAHYVFLTNPSEVAQEVETFVKRVLGSG
jgi:pimeloyl-ACP methyl ester carboxylesterase